jgi:amidase
MNRRSFIKSGTLAGIGLTALPLTARTLPPRKAEEAAAAVDDFLLNEATITELQQRMTSGFYTSRSLTQLYLDRIKKIDKNGPRLNAVIELNPDALQIADKMDAERAAGKVRSRLHGIPVLIKDNIDTGDKMMTTAGSLALEGHRAVQDAFVVKKLRDAGIVLLGKTNLSEWANFRSEKSTSGWSSRGGLTKNPCILDRNPSGSSSGSAVAVAANLCVVAVGTETDGSVTCPSSACGIAGLKPTVGLVSRSGIIPISHTQDTAGPMARTVTDLAILLGNMTGTDAEDVVTSESEGRYPTDYTQFLSKDSLKGARIGYDKKWKSADEKVSRLFEEARKVMENLGATLIEIELLEKINELSKSEFEVMKYEFKNDLNNYLSKANAGVKSLKELILFNKNNAGSAMPFFQQDILESSESKGDLNSKEYQDALNTNLKTSRELIDKVLKDNNLIAITGLTMSPACATDLVYGDKYGDIYAGMASAVSGYPHITLPCGVAYNLPVGLSFYSGAYTEPILIGLAYAYEQASRKRQSPGFLNSLI